MENDQQVTVLLVDDQSIMLDGIESLIEHMPDFRVVGRAMDGASAVLVAQELKPDVVVMDISMPGMDGIEATKRILKILPDTNILILSMYNNREFLFELLDAGASGYLLKNTGKDELMRALTMVSSGGRYMNEELRVIYEQNDKYKDRSAEYHYRCLTKREAEIVKMIIQERTTHEIADLLFLSPQTIETHRKNILHKLDVRNTAGLVKYAMERGWQY